MPFTVQQLIEGRQEPIAVSPSASIQTALELMIEHDFSQLPVLDENGGPLGIVTSDSIIRSLNHFGIQLMSLECLMQLLKLMNIAQMKTYLICWMI
jgi:CBS domain-containing protein